MNTLVIITDQKAVTTSLIVADAFEKQHKDILRAITRLECSEEFTERNFAPSGYKDSTGRSLPMYNITRDGFSFLAMGFTGKKAAEFKEAFIAQFNRMEQALLEGMGELKRVDVNMRHTRGITNALGLDIRYTLDLTKIAQKPNRIGIKMVERLSGVDLSDLVEELGKPLSRSAGILDQVSRCLGLLMDDDDPGRFGLVRGENEDGSEYLEGLAGTFTNAYTTITKEHDLPRFTESVYSLGAKMKDDALEALGWRKTLTKRIRGNRFFRYERIVNG